MVPRARALIVVLAACGSSSGGDKIARENRTGITEIEYAFADAQGARVAVDPADVRRVIAATGVEVYDCVAIPEGVRVRVPMVHQDPAAQEDVVATLDRRFTTIEDAKWTPDRLYLRASAPLPEAELRDVLDRAGFTVEKVDTPDDEGVVVTVAGAEQRYTRALDAALGVHTSELDVASVGPGGIH